MKSDITKQWVERGEEGSALENYPVNINKQFTLIKSIKCFNLFVTPLNSIPYLLNTAGGLGRFWFLSRANK